MSTYSQFVTLAPLNKGKKAKHAALGHKDDSRRLA
jgi:hypothetical protein